MHLISGEEGADRVPAAPPAVQYIGEVRIFGGGCAPPGWLECDGRLLAIDAHQPLFSVIGWRFGGDGETTFALPLVRFDASRSDALHAAVAIATKGLLPPRS